MGVNPLKNPIDIVIAVWKWGKYLGPEALEKGVDVCVSSWRRMAPDTMPALAKCAANYMSGQLIKMEAVLAGYVEGIALDYFGNISEGSGENIFIVKNGKVYTPSLNSAILPGITRDTVITLAKDLGMEVEERVLPRGFLYTADEVFFTGTAAEITPIRSIDKMPVGKGNRGPVTKQLQDAFFGVISGELEDRHRWLTYL